MIDLKTYTAETATSIKSLRTMPEVLDKFNEIKRVEETIANGTLSALMAMHLYYLLTKRLYDINDKLKNHAKRWNGVAAHKFLDLRDEYRLSQRKSCSDAVIQREAKLMEDYMNVIKHVTDDATELFGWSVWFSTFMPIIKREDSELFNNLLAEEAIENK